MGFSKRPFTGDYAQRVRWFKEVFDMVGDANQEFYGLAWSGVAGLPGDFNHDGTVDAADYVVWRKTGGTLDGYNAWRTNFGASLGIGGGSALPSAEPLSAAVPEPATVVLLILAVVGAVIRRNLTYSESQNSFTRETPQLTTV